jgi:Protein of unknown function (DUF4242)
MVFVVERYLPGLCRSELLHGLLSLEELRGDGEGVRYLGSTIVLGDEACYCRFEGPSEAAVAEVNRGAGLAYDRIVPVVTVKAERRRSMNVSGAAIPATVQISRSRLLVLIVAVAAVAAVATWVVSTSVVGTSDSSARTTLPSQAAVHHVVGSANGESVITSLTPAALQAGALGGYALPSVEREPTLQSVLASMSPATRRYTKRIMSLTVAQLDAGAAGSP